MLDNCFLNDLDFQKAWFEYCDFLHRNQNKPIHVATRIHARMCIMLRHIDDDVVTRLARYEDAFDQLESLLKVPIPHEP